LKNAQANTDSRMHIWLWGKGTTGDIVAGQPIGNVVADSLIFITSGEKYAKKYAVNELIADADGQVLHHRTNWLGTDRFGRDVLSRLIIGARVSLSVGFISVFISLFLGTIIGMAAGYFGGKTDSVLSWFIAVFWSVPTLLVALGLSFAFGKGYWQVLIACGLSTWVEVARVLEAKHCSLDKKNLYWQALSPGLGLGI
jgi:peptide/nickel transport system permease protein